jgi:hypothetical protein
MAILSSRRLCTLLAIDLLRLFDGARCERPFDLPFTRMIITGNGRRRVAIRRAATSDQS